MTTYNNNEMIGLIAEALGSTVKEVKIDGVVPAQEPTLDEIILTSVISIKTIDGNKKGENFFYQREGESPDFTESTA